MSLFCLLTGRDCHLSRDANMRARVFRLVLPFGRFASFSPARLPARRFGSPAFPPIVMQRGHRNIQTSRASPRRVAPQGCGSREPSTRSTAPGTSTRSLRREQSPPALPRFRIFRFSYSLVPGTVRAAASFKILETLEADFGREENGGKRCLHPAGCPWARYIPGTKRVLCAGQR